MRASGLSSALSGIQAAKRQISASSHNVANLLTERFRPLRASQSDVAEGGVRASVEQSEQVAPVDVAREIVMTDLATVQAKASARVVETELELLGSLLDLHA